MVPQVGAMLHHIEAGNLLPPLVVLSILAKNPNLQLSIVKDYIARQLSAESAHIQEDRAQIAKYQQETGHMRAEVKELRTQVVLGEYCLCVHVQYKLCECLNARPSQLWPITRCTQPDLGLGSFLYLRPLDVCMHSAEGRLGHHSERTTPVQTISIAVPAIYDHLKSAAASSA